MGAAAYLWTLAGADRVWLVVLVAPVAAAIGILVGCSISVGSQSSLVRLTVTLGAAALAISALSPLNGARLLMGAGLLLATVPPPFEVRPRQTLE